MCTALKIKWYSDLYVPLMNDGVQTIENACTNDFCVRNPNEKTPLPLPTRKVCFVLVKMAVLCPGERDHRKSRELKRAYAMSSAGILLGMMEAVAVVIGLSRS